MVKDGSLPSHQVTKQNLLKFMLFKMGREAYSETTKLKKS